MLLAIDTSTRYGGVALWNGERATITLCWYSTRNHTQELMPGIQTVLSKAGLKLRQLDGIGVALGPGGFSALRVGLSTAKGLAMPLGLPMVGVGTLEMEAYPFWEIGLKVHSILDIGRGEVATAAFAALLEGWTRVEEEHICHPQDLISALKGPALLCGEGVSQHKAALKDGLPPGSILVPFTSPANRLTALAEISDGKVRSRKVGPLASLQPLYLRRPNIGQPREPRRIAS